jgi:hypothetical protein
MPPRRRKRRSLGHLVVDLRTSVILLIAGALSGILMAGAGSAFLLRILSIQPRQTSEANEAGKNVLVVLCAVAVVVGLGLIAASILGAWSGVRVYENGVVYRRAWGKWIIPWIDVKDFYEQCTPGYRSCDGDVPDKYWWVLRLEDGTCYTFHDRFYNKAAYADAMDRLADELRRYREDFSQRYGPF